MSQIYKFINRKQIKHKLSLSRLKTFNYIKMNSK